MKTEEAILQLLEREGKLTTYMVAKMLDISYSTALNNLWKLKAEGKIRMQLVKRRWGIKDCYIWFI